MRFRPLLLLFAFVLMLGACGDDGGSADLTDGDLTAAPTPTMTGAPAPTGTVAGPTEGEVACARLAERYVRKARTLFDREGTPPDALVDRVRARLTDFDVIASTAGCGQQYVTEVCAGLDDLTSQGILVIIPLTTAQCG